jgi:hypothetical protein
MVQFEVFQKGARREHHGDWAGLCRACGLIWPCPVTRDKLRVLFADADGAGAERSDSAKGPSSR